MITKPLPTFQRLTFALILLLLASACQQNKQPPATKSTQSITCVPLPPKLNTAPGKDGYLTPLFAGLDVYHYAITTRSPLAQRYFNQGFLLNYGFNHAEAARSFQEVNRIDPECAMGYWGLAYVLGPNYNAPMFPDVLSAAKDAVAKAKLFSHLATDKEQALIKAISLRYPNVKIEDPLPFYEAYANEMRQVMNRFPFDMDIAAMTAEALLDLHPWDLWESSGDPKPWTPEIIDILEAILEQDSDHPQALHLYIHTLEASSEPKRALAAADKLRLRIPGAGHLLHMPSHIYINTGQYHKGVLANERAVKQDSLYSTACTAAGIYKFGLIPHNWHFLAACAALEGDGKKALYASRFMAETTVDEAMLYDPDWFTLQHYYSIPWYIMAKFSNWDEILAEPLPDPKLVYPTAVAAYARAQAFIGTKDFEAAEKEILTIEIAETDSTIQNGTIWEINSVVDLVRIAKHVTKARLAQAKGDFIIAESNFRVAIELEDKLNYNEPPDWFFSIRHLYGAALLEQKKYAEAVGIYHQDLQRFPSNGFALNGLATAYRGLGKDLKAEKMEAEFAAAWQWATVELTGSIVKEKFKKMD
ncbi:MAG: hypothetical protein AB8G22_16140 [Saprospiraceae bacterium]